MRVLVIEPDMVMAKNIVKVIGDFADMSVAFSSQEAIAVLDKNICDIIVLEPVVHGNNGIEFLHELRSYSDWQHIPVIVFSSMQKPQAADSLVQLGVQHWLQKSNTKLDQLAAVVKSAA